MLTVKPFSNLEVLTIELKGRVQSFESFGTVDGPGIRFVVFMQGCLLRCIYCHNRDTWDVDAGKEYTVGEVVSQIKKYRNYFKSSGGGVTFSGGEPTLQADFVTEVFRSCHDMGIHTALDTSGFTDIYKVEKLINYTDLVLLDIKHAEEEKHQAITGVSSKKIKDFAGYLSDIGKPIWIRYVLVPRYTDGEQDLKLASKFIKELKTVEKVEVLPYHSMGAYKWKELGCIYKLDNIEEPGIEDIEKARRVLGAY